MYELKPYCLSGLFLISWMIPITKSINGKTFHKLKTVIKQNENLIKGEFYIDKKISRKLNKSTIDCIYHTEGDVLKKITRCKEGGSCFKVYSTKFFNSKWTEEIIYQGCWYDDFKYNTQNCSSHFCRNNKRTKDTSNTYHSFCCCQTSLCNADIYMERNAVANVYDSASSKQDNGLEKSTLILAIATTVSTIIFVVICLLISYYWRKKHPRSQGPYSSIKKTLFNAKPSSQRCEQEPILSYKALADILHGNLIHQGFRSAVRLGTFEGGIVAIKVVPPSARQQWYNEKEIYQKIGSHPNIAQFITADILHDGKCFEGILIMKYYHNGSLLSFLRKDTLNVGEVFKLAYSLANGLAYLHGKSNEKTQSCNRTEAPKQSIAHLDLNCRNVLVTSLGTCAICDFGHAVDTSKKLQQKYFQMIGTPRYMSPEVLNRNEIISQSELKQVDIYSYGLILWEICRRSSIFNQDGIIPQYKAAYEEELGNQPSINSVKDHVCVKKNRPHISTDISATTDPVQYSFQEILNNSWTHDGRSRLSSNNILNKLDIIHRCVYPDSPPLCSIVEMPQVEVTEERFFSQYKGVIEESTSSDDATISVFMHRFENTSLHSL